MRHSYADDLQLYEPFDLKSNNSQITGLHMDDKNKSTIVFGPKLFESELPNENFSIKVVKCLTNANDSVHNMGVIMDGTLNMEKTYYIHLYSVLCSQKYLYNLHL